MLQGARDARAKTPTDTRATRSATHSDTLSRLHLMPIKKVWIEEGCISCNLCEDLCPEVFEVPAGETCHVKPDAAPQYAELDAKIKEAAESCPVEVIKLQEE